MKKIFIYLSFAAFVISCQKNIEKEDIICIKTYCNPLDLSYRFSLDEPSRREAADPTIVFFEDRYYLFASKSGGYWHSFGLKDWTFIETDEIPVEEYAPTAIVIENNLYFLASSNEKSTLYKTTDPLSGKWEVALDSLEMPVWDPAFFMDDDKRLYLYWGCSDESPLYGVEVNYTENFSFVGQPKDLMHQNTAEHGWEVPGDYNMRKENSPWIEGAWVNKVNGKYYLQYAGPGTEFKSYSDGVYTADNPLGPYTIAAHNPFSYKPEGFAAAAGHGSTFKDKYGNFWHVATSTISVKHIFERRLVMYPVIFDSQGLMHAYTKFGDYPFIIPDKKIKGYKDVFAGLMLLSYNKPVKVSSSVDSLPPSNMTNEDIRTYWAAKSGEESEFASIDLGNVHYVYAVQINFAEHNTKVFGRQKGLKHRYIIEYSPDGKDWQVLIDKSQNTSDNTHIFIETEKKINARFLKIQNIEVPDGHFAISGFRVFGKGSGSLPEVPNNFIVERNTLDRRDVHLNWLPSPGATGYNICYGSDEGRMYHHYQVYKDTVLEIHSLNTNQPYFFSIEAFNENGIGLASTVVTVE